jgi:transcriptional regulator
MKLPEDRSKIRLENDPSNPHRTIIHRVLEMDIAGWSQGKIAEDLGYTQSWICRIQNAPFYQGLRKEKLNLLHEKVTDKVSTHIADSEEVLKTAKLEAAETLVNLMRTGHSEAVKASVATQIVDRGREIKGGVNVVVQINEKLSERFDKVLKYDEGSTNRLP